MARNETLHIRVNENVKQNAERTLEMLGLSISEAVNMLIHQINLVGGLPFSVKIPSASDTAKRNLIKCLKSEKNRFGLKR